MRVSGSRHLGPQGQSLWWSAWSCSEPGCGTGSSSHQSCSGSGSLHGVTLGLCPPHHVCSSLGLQVQQSVVPGAAQNHPSDGPHVLGHPTLKMLGRGHLGPAKGSAEPLRHQPGAPPAGQQVGARTDPCPGNAQGGQVSSTVNQVCESRD